MELEENIKAQVDYEFSHRYNHTLHAYIDIAEDLIAGTLLSQIMYWFSSDRNGNSKVHIFKDGQYWLAKGREDWSNEIRISPKQYDNAIKKLKAKNLVETRLYKFNGVPMIHIRPVYKSINKAIELWKSEVADSIRNSDVDSNLPKGQDGFYPNGKMEVDETVKSLTETTYRDYNTKTTEKKNAPLESKLPNGDKYMTSNTSVFSSHGKPKDKRMSQKETESVIKNELRRLRSNTADGLIEDKSKTEEWVNKEYKSLSDIMAEFNRQYKESTGLNPKTLSKDGLVKLVKSYIKSPESLKYDYDDLESNKVMIEAYLKADYSSYGHVSKSLSHYMSGMIRENLFYKNLL